MGGCLYLIVGGCLTFCLGVSGGFAFAFGLGFVVGDYGLGLGV